MTTTAKTTFRFVGQHLDDLADGRILEPGATYNLDKEATEDPHNAQRITEGLLVEVQRSTGKES